MDDNFLSDNDFDSEEETYTVEYKKKVDLEPKSSPMNEEDDPNPNKNKISISKSEKKSGVVYLSSVPTSMNVKKLNEEFSKYGDLGRIYLKPEENCPNWKKNRKFKEGWVEFSSKKVAKMVAANLNNKQVGGKRHNPWYYDLWNIKYLNKFKWLHLNEKLNSQRIARKKKLKMEISSAKKDTNRFKEIVEREKANKKREDRTGVKKEEKVRSRPFTYKQDKPFKADSNKNHKVKANDENFLKNIFSGGFA